jgi:phenylalanyl-tRNA synthetase alpha chain
MDIQQISHHALEALSRCQTLADVQAVEVQYLGKKGELTAILRTLGSLQGDEKRALGQQINQVKSSLIEAFNHKKSELERQVIQAQIDQATIDITLPGRGQSMGTLHPISIVTNRLTTLLAGMGFSVVNGPEIEDDYHNFEALNFPDNHPARQMQDTFFLDDDLLLRTHTSSVQIRTMENQSPPIKIVAPGKAFRADEIDATHTPMFHQIEGLAVDKDLSFSDLKSVVYSLLRHYFCREVKIRFRPSYFPFTEPSAEVDLWHDGQWLEVMGCGMVHPNVLTMAKIDPSEYSGYAFGMGIDRLAMLTYGISDLRDLFSNDIRVLSQFNVEQWGDS